MESPNLAALATLTVPSGESLIKASNEDYEIAECIVIETREDAQAAADELKRLAGRLKSLEEQRRRLVDPLNAAKQAAQDLFNPPAERLQAAVALLKRGLLAWEDQQRRLREAEQEAARQAAEKERVRIEAAAAAEEAARVAEAAALAAQAQQATAAGDVEAAAALRAQAEAAEVAAIENSEAMRAAAAQVVAPIVAAPVKVSGAGGRANWKAEITNMQAFVEFVVQNPQYMALLKVDQQALNQQAKSLKQLLKWPGVRVFDDRTIAVRA
ncbi:MAG: hypothetical protein E6Q97_00700 [Desulfurellales bacterium]|nr:MAG: hypothetical protein E6Q97_00700 [Desulfurellales bacterium]